MARRELRDLAANLYRGAADAIEGERIIAQARDIGKPIVVPGTSTHRIQQCVLTVNALCIIDRPFRLREPPLTLR
jgi:hypothetical protein